MDITISNCNNVSNGTITIEKNNVNIKYGINGTGKSTIANAIKYKVLREEDITKLKPFNTEETIVPSVVFSEEINSIKIYNEDYVSQYLFKDNGSNLIQNSFEVFIKPIDYDEKTENINNIIKVVKDYVLGDELLNTLVNQKNDLFSLLKINNAGTSFNKTGLYKALETGNKIVNIPINIKKYDSYLYNANTNSKWYTWQNDGRQYIISDKKKCPFCTSDLIETYLEEFNLLDQLFDKKNVEAINKASGIFEKFENYVDINNFSFLNELTKKENAIDSTDNDKLTGFYKELNAICNNIEFFKGLDFITIRNIDDLSNKIALSKVNVDELKFINNNILLAKIKEFNGKVDELLLNISNLQIEINVLKSSINNTVNKNKVRINNFLKTVGMNYEVQLLNDNNIILNFKDTAIVVNPIEHLSWGERNCFALALFLFECIHQNSDLIILDDPVSSFDINKKFGIMHYLFNAENSLKGRTVLILTHDLEPIINMCKVKEYDFVKCTYIENNHGNVLEHNIKKNNIYTIIDVAKQCFENDKVNVINRLVHLRRYLELNNEYEMEYNMISSVFKATEVPIYRDRNRIINDRTFTVDEIKETENKIRKYVDCFDYNNIYQIINDIQQMKKIYLKSSNNYEKIEIFRITAKKFGLCNGGKVIEKFIDETFHIENSYVFQLNPYAYNQVPSYIVDVCDNIINNIPDDGDGLLEQTKELVAS